MMDAMLRRPRLSKTVSPEDRHLIDSYIKKNGVRKFEEGLQADQYGLKDFLALHGWDMKIDGNARFYRLKKASSPGRHKKVLAKEVIKLVDQIRVGLGLTPLRMAETAGKGKRK